MYIIDKNKDYYDYLKGTYGIDKMITYDRRGSTVISEFSLLEHLSGFIDVKDLHDLMATKYFIVEIGTIQYIFEVKITYRKNTNSKWEFNMAIPVSGKYSIIGTLKDHKHYFDKEISIVPFKLYGWKYDWAWRKKKETKIVIKSWSEVTDIQKDKIIINPIFGGTSIASFIPPLDIWIELNNFISSKYNDKIVEIKNSDVDKIVNHGFDKKASFRNPTKWNK